MTLRKPSLDWLLIFVPLAIGLHAFAPGAQLWTFCAAGLAVIPLAGWLGKATEELADRAGGGHRRAAERHLRQRGGTDHRGVRLAAGAVPDREGVAHRLRAGEPAAGDRGRRCWRAGRGANRSVSTRAGARVQTTMLTLAAIAFIAPAAFHHLAGAHGRASETTLSTEISLIMLATYALSLLFTLRTHKQFFTPGAGNEPPKHGAKGWSVRRSVAVLAGATVLIAWISEVPTGTVDAAAHALGMTDLFVGGGGGGDHRQRRRAQHGAHGGAAEPHGPGAGDRGGEQHPDRAVRGAGAGAAEPRDCGAAHGPGVFPWRKWGPL